MFNWFKSQPTFDPLNSAMALYEQVYLNDVRSGTTVGVANDSATQAAEGFMTQYLTFKERGL